MPTNTQRAGFFYTITRRPGLVLAVSLVAIVIAAAGLGRLVKDTSVKAFIPTDHPVLQADNHAADVFGLSDTIAVAILSQNGNSVFTPEAFQLITQLTDDIAALENVREDRVTSLATEVSISGDDGAVDVIPYIDTEFPETVADARERWANMPPHVGSIVSEDATGTVILAELVDSDQAGETYQHLLAMVSEIQSDSYELHVAGPGAVSGYLNSHIDADARQASTTGFRPGTWLYLPGVSPLSRTPGTAAGRRRCRWWLAWHHGLAGCSVLRDHQRAAGHRRRDIRCRRYTHPVGLLPASRTTPGRRRTRPGCAVHGFYGEADYAHHTDNHRRICGHRNRVHHAAYHRVRMGSLRWASCWPGCSPYSHCPTCWFFCSLAKARLSQTGAATNRVLLVDTSQGLARLRLLVTPWC